MDDKLQMGATREDEQGTARLEAFSDGVFAIAVTLLILDLNVPEWSSGGPSLLDSLVKLWPGYLAFLTSFATIGVMWANHHRIFTHVKRMDNMLLLLNGLLLLGVTVVPFPTKVLARYLGHDPDEAVAAMLYNGVFVLLSIVFNLLWRYSSKHDRLLGANVDRQGAEAITQQYKFGPAPYSVAFLLALLGIWFSPAVFASILISLALAVYFALPGSAVSRGS